MYSERSWLTAKEAGDLCGYTSRHIQNLIKKGKLSATKDDDGRYYIEKSEFFRVFPHALKQEKKGNDANKSEINDAKLLQAEINHLRQMLSEKSRQNEFLKEQLDTFTEEKSKMLDAINCHARLLEHKDSAEIRSKKFSLKNPFKKS